MPDDVVGEVFYPGDEIGAIKLIREAFIEARIRFHPDGQMPPTRQDIVDSLPIEFQYEEHKGLYSYQLGHFWIGPYLTVPSIAQRQLDYSLKQQTLNNYTDSIVYHYVDSAINTLLSYAEQRNGAWHRRDYNLSFARNRVISWICNELLQVVAGRNGTEQLRRLKMLHYFIARLTNRSNVEMYYPESSRDDGADGFPAQLNRVNSLVERMQQITKSAMEMKSLGDMFADFGSSLGTSIVKMGVFALYFVADKVICKNRRGLPGTPFDIMQFYRHNISAGKVVGERHTAKGKYEHKLANSVLGKVMIHFLEMMKHVENQEPFDNRFLVAANDVDRQSSFRSMASYILETSPRKLPHREFIWSGFEGSEYFPLEFADGTVIDGKSMPAEVVRLFGYLLEAAKIAQQFKKLKPTANFVGDYNMVYNAHLHWGLQSLMLQWSVVKSKIDRLKGRLDLARQGIVDEAPRADTPFHKNSPVMISQLEAAESAFIHVAADRDQIVERLEQLKNKGYLDKSCKEAREGVKAASDSAKALHDAGVLSDEDFKRSEKLKPADDSGFDLDDIQDPLLRGASSAASKNRSITTLTLNRLANGASDLMGALERDLQADQGVISTVMIDNHRHSSHFYYEHYRLLRQQNRFDCLFPLLVSIYKSKYSTKSGAVRIAVLTLQNYRIEKVIGRVNGQSIAFSLNPITGGAIGNIQFTYRDLIEYFGTSVQRKMPTIDKHVVKVLVGKFAFHNQQPLELVPPKASLCIASMDDPAERAEHLKASMNQYWQQLVAAEQALDKLTALWTAFDEVEQSLTRSHDDSMVDWGVVDRLASPVRNDILWRDAVTNYHALLNNIGQLINSAKTIRAQQYEAACQKWHVKQLSRGSFEDVCDELQDKFERCSLKMQSYTAAIFDKKVVSLDDIKQQVLQRYRPQVIKPVDSVAPVSQVFSKAYNIAFVDGRGNCQFGTRFALPDFQHPLCHAITASPSFQELGKNIRYNQAYYDRHATNFKDRGCYAKLNYAISGAAKAAVMQAYCNELMLRINVAVESDAVDQERAWDRVYCLLGGESASFDSIAQRKEFLSKSNLSFSVNLCLPSGDFSSSPTSFNCASHRAKRQGAIQSQNFWGMRGSARLPSTSHLLIDFVKSARAIINQHLAQPRPAQPIVHSALARSISIA